MFQEINSFIRKNLTILLFALILRLILMPFFFHPDLKTQNFHGNFFPQGVFNIYQYIEKNKKDLPYRDNFNYPPLSYFFLGGWNFLTSPLLGESYQRWMGDWSESWFTNPNIFRHLFLLKTPYLIFDILTGIIVALILEEKYRRKILVLWFFNPISLYIIYGISNFDIIPTFLTLLSVYYLKKGNFAFSGLSLGFAVSFKVYPLLFLPFFLIFFLKQKKVNDGFKFLAIALLPIFISLVAFPDYLKNASNSGFSAKLLDLKVPLTSVPLFLALYAITLLVSLKRKVDWEGVCFYILTTSLLVYCVSKFHPQWLIWVIPFFLIFAARNLKLLIFSLLFLLGYLLSIINFEDRFITLGILSPIFPDIYEVGFLEETIFSIFDKKLLFYLGKTFIVLGAVVIVFTILKNFFRSFNFNPSLLKIYGALIIMNFLIFISILVLGLFYSSDRILISKQLRNVGTEDIYKNHDVTFNFKPDHDNLNLVFIQLKNPGFFNIDPFIFSIEETAGKTLTQLEFSGRNLGDGDFARFQFPPLKNIAGKDLTLRLKSPTEEKDKIIQVVIDDSGVINHKMFGQSSITEESPLLISNFLTRFSMDKFFLITYSVMLFSLIFILVATRKLF